MRRILVTALVLALVAGSALAVLTAHRGTSRAATGAASGPAARVLPRVDSTLPAWAAPGALIRVDGFAHPTLRVLLKTSTGHTLARVVSGPHGHFRFRFRAPGPGRYQLRVESDGIAPVGSLLVRPLVLAAVGDVTFGEQVGPAVLTNGAAYPWTGVARALSSADLTVGNLETSISTRGVATRKQYAFRGPPQAMPALKRVAGFDVLTLANNHSVDYGPQALLDTIRYARAAGIDPIGAGTNDRSAYRPALVEAGGLRIAFLGFSDVNPPGFTSGPSTPGTARADPATIAADVQAARRRADVVVCFFHWGVELQPQPDARQRSLASACLDAGAQVVLGAHPHVLGPVERPGPRSLVAWTLGNFLFPSSGLTARSGILEVRLGAAGVLGYRLRPVQIVGFRPQLVPGSG